MSEDNGASVPEQALVQAPSPDGLGPTGFDPSRVRGWLVSMTRYGEDAVWRGAERALAWFDHTSSEAITLRDLLETAYRETDKARTESDKADAEALEHKVRNVGVAADALVGSYALVKHFERRALAAEKALAQAIEARSGESGTGSIGAADESAVPSGMRPDNGASLLPEEVNPDEAEVRAILVKYYNEHGLASLAYHAAAGHDSDDFHVGMLLLARGRELAKARAGEGSV